MTRTSLTTDQDCLDFVEGCLFMGTGGGGSADVGIEALRVGLAEGLDMGWVDVDDIADDTLTVTAYSSGSIAPDDGSAAELVSALQLDSPQSLDDALAQAVEELGRHLGQPVGAIVPVELGASNSPGPIVAAARMGLMVPDGDYSGRAVPEEAQGTPFIYGIRSDPFASVDAWGTIAVVSHVANAHMLERVSKMLSVAGIDGTSVASTALAGRDMKRIIVAGTLTKSLRIGRAARLAREGGEDPVDAAIDAADGWRMFDGEIVAKEWEDRDGYMYGTLTLAGTASGSSSPSELRIWFKNENHITWLDGEPWVCSPDLITVVDSATGRAFTSTDIAEGDKVSVVGMSGLDVFRTDHALANAFGPEYFGFGEVTYQPIESLLS